MLIGLLTVAGIVFGLFGGLLTRVRYSSGNVYIKATVSAAALWVVAQGLNNRQVAKEMFVSEATVKTHLNHILAKLALQDRGALIAWA